MLFKNYGFCLQDNFKNFKGGIALIMCDAALMLCAFQNYGFCLQDNFQNLKDGVALILCGAAFNFTSSKTNTICIFRKRYTMCKYQH